MPKEIVSFEHFDPTLEIGIVDELGQSIKPRKKPGRKPNPPSPAQRKAQNRAAQRAFRERKRSEMKEAQLTAKKALHIRNQALRQIKNLKRRIEELEYETKYLKGYTLTLKLACVANQVEVPKFWDNGLTDEIGSDEMSFSKSKGIPQPLEFILDKNLNLIGFDQLLENQDMENVEIPPRLVLSPKEMNSPSVSSASSFSEVMAEEEEDLYDVVKPILQKILQTHENKVTGDTDVNNSNGQTITPVFPSASTSLLEEYLEDENDEEKICDPKTGILRMVTEPVTPDVTKFSQEKKIFPPMTAHEAVKMMKTIKHVDEDTLVLFTPTELQRTIRHDPRIDSIPGPAYRDHMILFQDYYNANELFEFLAENSVFLGGELGNLDSWFVPTTFYKKYWFLCPNHHRDRIDNSVEVMIFLNKKMMELLEKRKEMYLERERYSDYFPTPSVDEEEDQQMDMEDMEKINQQILYDIIAEEQEPTEPMEEDASEVDQMLNENQNYMQPLKLLPSHLPLEKYQLATSLLF